MLGKFLHPVKCWWHLCKGPMRYSADVPLYPRSAIGGFPEKLSGEHWWGCSSPWWNPTAPAALVLLVPPRRSHTAECRQCNATCSQWRNLERMFFWFKKKVLFFSSTQMTKIKSAWFFFLQPYMWNSEQLLPFKGVWEMLGNLSGADSRWPGGMQQGTGQPHPLASERAASL